MQVIFGSRACYAVSRAAATANKRFLCASVASAPWSFSGLVTPLSPAIAQ
ncbi:hypothetical protein [Franconibacter helveticus]|nr:hypothetical protein [Franconibacter helveticus]